VNQILAQKGFIEDPANPDFLISYDAGAGDLPTDMEAFAHARRLVPMNRSHPSTGSRKISGTR